MAILKGQWVDQDTDDILYPQTSADMVSTEGGKNVDVVLKDKAEKNHTHNATQISQDTSHRFVTDQEKTTWNSKANASHTHTSSQVGLSNVTNDAQVKRSEMGKANGVPTLDTESKIPFSQFNANNALKNKKCLLLGDSYLRGTGGIADKGWGYYFREYSGATCSIHQNAGGGFIAKGGTTSMYTGKNYYEILNTVLPSISAKEKKEYEYVIISGGYNDGKDEYYNGQTIMDEIQKCVTLIRSHLINAKIYIVPTYCEQALNNDTRLKAYLAYVQGAIKAGAVSNSNSIFWFCGRTAYGAGDNVHLNDNGYQQLGRYITSFVLGWNGDFQVTLNAGEIKFESGVSVSSGQRFRMYRKDGIVHVMGSLKITSVSASKVLLTMPSDLRPWGRLVVPAVFQTSNAYKIVPIAITEKNIALTGDVGGISGTADLRICTSYPMAF